MLIKYSKLSRSDPNLEEAQRWDARKVLLRQEENRMSKATTGVKSSGKLTANVLGELMQPT